MTTADPSPEYWLEYGPFQHAKHRLIKHYLDGWFPKLGTWAGRVLYIDTHAGRGRHSSGEPFLIAPEPDLALLRRWVLERLQNGTYDKDELQTELRSEPWLVTHLNKVMKLLLRDGAIDRASGAFSLMDSPRLPGLNGGAD